VSVAAVALSTLLQQCAPNVGERTMTAIVRVESKGYPLAIYDNTTGRSYSPTTTRDAMDTARSLIDAGHSVDLGLAQVNSANLPRLGMEVRDAFDPCSNLRGAATILMADYGAAASQFSPGPYALRRAIGAYNSGSIYRGDAYLDRILEAAGLPPNTTRGVPDLESPGPSAAEAVLLPAAGAPLAVPNPPAVVPRVHPAPPKPAPTPNPFAAPIIVMSAAAQVPETILGAPQPTASPAPGT
jgi:type IV secretion system protein VirB1